MSRAGNGGARCALTRRHWRAHVLVLGMSTALGVAGLGWPAGWSDSLWNTGVAGGAQARSAPLAQRLDALEDRMTREARALRALEQDIRQHALAQANRRGFVSSGSGWRLQRDGGATIEIDAGSVSIVVPGGGSLRVDSSGGRLFGPLVRLGGSNGMPLARVTDAATDLVPIATSTPWGTRVDLVPKVGSIANGASNVLVGD